jgi:hypothetical protein
LRTIRSSGARKIRMNRIFLEHASLTDYPYAD